MYLTDYRERSLKDVITQLEPGLFKKVTGLSVKDFELLCSLGVFNAPLMNDAIFKFKRYEDSSLSYTGIEKHISDEVGGWDTTIRREEYERLFYNQQAIMEAPSETFTTHVSQESMVANEIAENNSHSISNDITPRSIAHFPIYTTVVEDKQKEPPSIDLSDIAVGTVVTHSKFGEGKIANIDKAGKYIHVTFSVGEKTFACTAFDQGFLKLK